MKKAIVYHTAGGSLTSYEILMVNIYQLSKISVFNPDMVYANGSIMCCVII